MVSLNIDGEDYIMVLGGYGQRLIDTQTQFEYTTSVNHPNLCYTNEIHIKDISSSSGQWKLPVITGDCPLPHAYSTVISLSGNRAVMFGGRGIDGIHIHSSSDVMLFTISPHTVDFQKVVKPCGINMPWPMGRFRHASGQGYNHQPLSDCWMVNLDSVKWCQVI